ncbi:MAG: GNAT family N-acetyltransferase [Akkermansiaceae bacterium]|nr:GNAT family N-acetyltransferase [Akkermansiaceae bacterium]NNM29077.1 GNAT family N-acetyltransferase [Akkermansiaceae bacterium]
MQKLEFGSPEYEEALALRRRVLRDPLGIFWTPEEKAMEPGEWQFAGFDDGAVVACVSARWLEGRRVKVRQMAVAPDRQRSGLGRAIMGAVEARLVEEGAAGFELHAREEAVGFYEKLGYTRVGGRFEEVGIPHWKMEKDPGGSRGRPED